MTGLCRFSCVSGAITQSRILLPPMRTYRLVPGELSLNSLDPSNKGGERRAVIYPRRAAIGLYLV